MEGFLGLYTEDENLVYFQPGATVYVDGRRLRVSRIRRSDKGYQVCFEGVEDRSAAEGIRNREVFVGERRALGRGEYWPQDLIGLQVRPGGGVVVGVEHGPTQDRLVVERRGGRFEVPFVEALVPVVDIDEGYVEVVELPGLTEHQG